MPPDAPHVLLVNPWIHDFAAYDFWAKPLGLLTLAAILRQAGFAVSYVDCLDRFHPLEAKSDPFARCGRGPYRKTGIPKPPGLADVPRRFSRYGIRPEWLRRDLADLPKPDLILLGSMMTYWYPGVAETAQALRSAYGDIPILLGGIYATLCPDHARRCIGAHRVLSGSASDSIARIAGDLTGWPAGPSPGEDMDAVPLPAVDLQRRVGYVPLLTSRGCPFSCEYCASGLLEPRRSRRSVESVVEEIKRRYRDLGVVDFVFYDDALLVDAETHAVPLFESLIEADLPVRFHTPNALHIRAISEPLARLMKRVGFHTLRLGLETAEGPGPRLDRKVTEEEFFRAAGALKKAGFGKDQVGAYLLVGLPGQRIGDVLASISVVQKTGIRPIPAYYSPIPGTGLWPEAVRASRYPLEADPVYTNNAVLPCWDAFRWETVTRIKEAAGR
jgi:radical SAM superfamily enzyme YgiQ (UPF0313 family)